MSGNTTTITHPTDPKNVKTFNFDYSYWSHDGFKTDADNILVADGPTSAYTSQQKVFSDLGVGVLTNAMNGYNCSLFAYGQTGSGKSYSMIGFENNKGIVPITCNELFKIIESKRDASVKYGVQFSMLEIYNERIRDLLVPPTASKNNLAVRESKSLGFYVQDLMKVPVGSYEQIESRMNKGTSNRTIAATQMNATSSRAHTVVTIEFNQLIKAATGTSTKTSIIQLIDLAGSERADSTGATGDRLMEGASINKSLSALGNVISALVDSANGNKSIVIPYRDSVLTKLLKNALGGNSKTVMIAALSPADINYDETISTLRYADRVKRIKNTATINENPLEKLIRELREENEKLKMALNGQLPKGINTKGLSKEDIQRLRKEIEEELRQDIQYKSEILDFQNSDKWEAKVRAAEDQGEGDIVASEAKKTQFPHFTNLNEDPQLNGALCFFIETPRTVIGKSLESPDNLQCQNSVRIFGPGVQDHHAIISYNIRDKSVLIKPFVAGAVVKRNGKKIEADKETTLFDKDRLVFGSTNLYLFHNPFETRRSNTDWDWSMAQAEIAEAEGFNIIDLKDLEYQIIEILPMIQEVNAISEEMGKQKMFNVLIIPEVAQDVPFRQQASPKVMIKMTNMKNNNTWMWERSHFINRRYIIQEMYERFLDGEDISLIPEKKDPFWEQTEDILVGHAHAFLQNLLYNIGLSHDVNVIDYKGRAEGTLSLKIEPSSKDGKVLDSQDSVMEDSLELLGKPYYMKVSIDHLTLYKSRFIHGSNVKFSVYRIDKVFETVTSKNNLESDFHYEEIISWPSITVDHLDYFRDGMIVFRVYGIQKDAPCSSVPTKMGLSQARSHISAGVEANKIKTEHAVMRTLNNQQSRKIERIRQLCMEWERKPANEKLFEPFFRSISAISFSSGSKFKTMAMMVGKTVNLGKEVRNTKLESEKALSRTGRAKTVFGRK